MYEIYLYCLTCCLLHIGSDYLGGLTHDHSCITLSCVIFLRYYCLLNVLYFSPD